MKPKSSEKPRGSRKTKPLPVRVGRTVIPIYKLARHGFQARYYVAGEAKRITRASEEELRSEVEGIATGIENGRVQAGDLSAADVQGYYHAMTELGKMGGTAPPLHVALAEYVSAKALLPDGMSLGDAVRFMLQHLPAGQKRVPLVDVIDPFLASVGDTAENPRHLRGLRCDLRRFAAWLPAGKSIGEVTADEIQTYLRALVQGTMTDVWNGRLPKAGTWPAVGPRRRDNIRDAIAALFGYAKTHGQLPEDRLTQAEKVRPLDAVHEIRYYTPEQLCSFLAYVDEKWLPWLVLGAFAGIRSSEIVGDPEKPNRPRLRWSDFRWDKPYGGAPGHIVVPKVAAKKIKRSRRVPLRANLLEWLLPWRNATGYLYAEGDDQSEQTAKFEAGIKVWNPETARYDRGPKLAWDNNALRHSYGTHRIAELGNAGVLAEEMGTSVQMIRKHYDAVPADVEPGVYFGIRPDPAHARKIIGMDGSALG